MKTADTESARLRSAFKKALKDRKVNIHSASLAMGVHYITLYLFANPEKHSGFKGKAKGISYDIGKRIENWINKQAH